MQDKGRAETPKAQPGHSSGPPTAGGDGDSEASPEPGSGAEGSMGSIPDPSQPSPPGLEPTLFPLLPQGEEPLGTDCEFTFSDSAVCCGNESHQPLIEESIPRCLVLKVKVRVVRDCPEPRTGGSWAGFKLTSPSLRGRLSTPGRWTRALLKLHE